MGILRTVKCDICEEIQTEKIPGMGWPGWGMIQGRQGPNGETDFYLCPEHLDLVFDFIDSLIRGR